jgi:hypothetical protein
MLYSEWAANHYADFVRTLPAVIENQWHSQIDVFAREVCLREHTGLLRVVAQQQVLESTSYALTEIFKISMATALGLQNVVAGYHQTATWQYLIAPRIYERLWGRVLPESIRRDARIVLDRYASEGLPTGGPA